MTLHSFSLTAAIGILACAPASAELILPHFFSDHMVFQRDKPLVIWGQTDPGKEVIVSFDGDATTVTSNANGDWKATLKARSAQSNGADLKITSGDDTRTLTDVLVGEVWFASGQSNMAWTLSKTHQAEQDIAAADHPGIRVFQAKRSPAAKPQKDIDGEWLVSAPETAGSFTAVGYFFALELHKALDVPVGIISSSWGGKPVETFTSREALATLPEGKEQLAKLEGLVDRYDPEKAAKQYETAQAAYQKKLAAWKAKSKDARGQQPRRPTLARDPAATEGRPGVLYNGMIHPFVGYPMRGAIWYQGEANAKTPETAAAYGKLFPLMINDWRKRWNDEFTFLWVQLANFQKATDQPGAVDPWAELQNEQRKTLSLTKTGMAVANDIGAANDIHPRNKKEVGRRLALWALAKDYARKTTFSGPLYSNSIVEGSEIRINFDQASGLKSRDGKPLKRFAIAGDDQVWHWANARIEEESVIVSSSKVTKPVAARYAWSSNPEGANLVNGEDLPASVFSTEE
ncbi:sialate O-acetylesterase [Haloferula chungangensis]|uniref:Sialate O-acetylesterase n=1 Tax=Haloferula chungangensis TaxID=1048331 RepID=A0ABW2L8D8_9BACT